MAERAAPYAGAVNWDALTVESRWTLRHVAVPMLEGDEQREITDATGISGREITARLAVLKDEIEAQAGSVNTAGSRVVYTRELFEVQLEASDFELAQWRIEARRRQMSIDGWLRMLANDAAGK